MTTPRSVILLAGAPVPDDLQWDDEHLSTNFDDSFTRLIEGRRQLQNLTQSLCSTATAPAPKWRSFRIEVDDGVPSGTEQVEDVPGRTQFLSFSGTFQQGGREHSDFIEHSIAVFDDLVSSQIQQRNATQGKDGNTFAEDLTSFMTTTSMTNSVLSSQESPDSPAKKTNNVQNFAITGGVNDLKQVPTAVYIKQILPQTMTVNLVVGVVTVSPPRTVHLKQSNAEMDIVEIVVGDETRSGFTISFWHVPAESQNKPVDDLRQVVAHLRTGDVVLLQNVALSAFRESVYGQSLNRQFARNSTFVTTINDRDGTQLPTSVRAKLQRVQDWIFDFVGVGVRKASAVHDTSDARGRQDSLPPDTQDD